MIEIASRPKHSDSVAEHGESPASPEYNLFFDDVERGLNRFLRESIPVPSYAVANLPDATINLDGMVIVQDEVGGRTLATSDGTNWRRVSDGAIVS